MKCPNCGAETTAKFCEYCGSEVVKNKPSAGRCPNCGGNKVNFKRERVGSATHSQSRKNVIGSGRTRHEVNQAAYRTVGVCQNCGYTWSPNAGTTAKKKKTWLWVLGWICIFPVPLTILMLRKKDMKPAVKYGIIAVAWVLYLIIGLSGDGSTEAAPAPTDAPIETAISQVQETTTEATVAMEVYRIVGGELGELGVEVILNKDSDFPDTRYEYQLPAGTYEITNTDTQYLKQLDILLPEVEKNSDGIEEQPIVSSTMFNAGETKVITIENGQVVEIEAGEVWEFKKIV